jgi:hypothetical protein
VLEFPPMTDLSGNVLDFPAASPLPVSDEDDDDPDDSDYDPEEDEEESESESEYDSDDAEEVDEDEDEEDEEVDEELEDTEAHYAPSFTAFAPEEVDFPSFLRQEVTLKCNVPVGALVAVFFTAFFYVTVAAIASQRR